MSALDLTRYETTIRRCVATLLHASYTDGIPTETTDAWRTFAADASRDLTALITRLRAAEARTAWQPIETVAVDETVLLWDPVRRGVRMGHVSIRRGCIYTHWMTLPAAPEAP
jgi:hypothetical protein